LPPPSRPQQSGGGGGNGGGGNARPASKPAPNFSDMDDDIPF
jgi:single-strand DNA-binding protein